MDIKLNFKAHINQRIGFLTFMKNHNSKLFCLFFYSLSAQYSERHQPHRITGDLTG